MNRTLIACVVGAALFSSFASAVDPRIEATTADAQPCAAATLDEQAVAFDSFTAEVARYSRAAADCPSAGRLP
jgi:hypothetical protein